jgi:hypothetical protein
METCETVDGVLVLVMSRILRAKYERTSRLYQLLSAGKSKRHLDGWQSLTGAKIAR